MSAKPITIMGIFAVDLTFQVGRLPLWGETVLASDFRLGPGGKGSNQAIAAARLGGQVHFLSKVGSDLFGEIALRAYEQAGVHTQLLAKTGEIATGAAAIMLDEARGENAIMVAPGASNALTFSEIDRAEGQIAASAVFMTQLELPLPTVERGLALAHRLGVPTILNPAPARGLAHSVLELCDYLTPNEHEAAALTGLPVDTLEQAEEAAGALLGRGVRNVVLTLGARGALIKNASLTRHISAVNAGPVVETTGAGDAFNGALAAGLAEGMDLPEAARFAAAVAGISVTRPGAALSMPTRVEVETLLQACGRNPV